MLDTIESFNRTETRLFLTQPDRTTVCELHTAYGITRDESYGGINQLSFKLPYRVMVNMKYVRNFTIDLTSGDYLIRVEKGLSMEYYIITSFKNEYSNGIEIRTVNCNIQPYELSYKVLTYYKNTKPLYDFVGHNSILHDTVLALSDYTIGYVNASIGIQYRAIEVAQIDLLSFLNQLANTFNLIVTFNSINKTISFNKETELGNDLGAVLDESNLKSIAETENHAEVITKLICEGANKLTFAKLSPTGTNYIEDFSYYMRGYTEDANGVALTHSKGLMSDSLCHAILVYNKRVLDSGTTMTTLITQRETLVSSKIPYTIIANQLLTDMNLINKNIDISIKNGSDLTQYNANKAAKQIQIDANQALLTAIDAQIAIVDTSTNALNSSLSMQSNFTVNQLKEKLGYTKERVWSDSKYVDPKDLYNDAVIRLKSISQPIFQLQCDIVDITMQLNDTKDWDKVKIGSIVTVRFEDFEDTRYVKAKIITLSHSEDDQTLKVTIANSKDIKSGFLKFADLLTKAVSTSAMVDFKSGDWALAKNANDTVTQILNNKWDAVKNAIVGGVDENVVVDGRGITMTTPSDTQNFLRAVHNVIAFTNNGGLSYKNALTSTGLVAEAVYGTLIAGNNLLISNQSGTFAVNGAGVTVSGATFRVTGGIPDDQIQSSANWNSAAEKATAALLLLADLSNDDKITAVEKQLVKKEWDIIFAEKNGISTNADAHLVTTEKTTYIDAYNVLATYITPILADLTTTSDIVGSTFRINFKNYYDARTALLKAIADKAVSLDVPYDNVVISSLVGINVIDSLVKSKTIMNSGGFKIQKNTGTTANPVWSTQLSADGNGNLSITGAINATSGTFNGTVNANSGVFSGNITASGTITGGDFISTRLNSAVLTGGSINIGSGVFTVNTSGVMSCTGANISGNINMTGGTISWGSIVAPSYGQINGSKPPTNADNTNSALGSALGSNYTVIGNTYVYTGTLTATQVNAVNINATSIKVGTLTGIDIRGTNITGLSTIDGATITGSVINVISDLRVGNNIYLNNPNNTTADKSIVFFGRGNITFATNGVSIAANQQIDLSCSFVTYNGEEVATHKWVTSNAVGTAKFA